MANKDISKVLTKGSLKQRVTLLFTDQVNLMRGKEPLLTPKEKSELVDSFKSSEEIRYYNKHAKIGRNIFYLSSILREKELQYNEAVAHLGGLTTTWFDYRNIEQFINTLLLDIKDKKVKGIIKKTIINDNFLVYADFTEDKAGLIKVKTKGNIESGNIYLEELVNGFSKKATAILTQTKTYIKVMRDYLNGEGFYIQAYKDFIDNFEADLKRDRTLISIYSKKEAKELFSGKYEILYKLYEKYFVYPDYDELEITEKDYKEVWEVMEK